MRDVEPKYGEPLRYLTQQNYGTEEILIIIKKSSKLYSQKRPGDATASYNCPPPTLDRELSLAPSAENSHRLDSSSEPSLYHDCVQDCVVSHPPISRQHDRAVAHLVTVLASVAVLRFLLRSLRRTVHQNRSCRQTLELRVQ